MNTGFIHSLLFPTVIVSNSGEIIDANKSLLDEGKYTSKMQLIDMNVKDLFVDKSKCDSMFKFAHSGRPIQNQKILLKTPVGIVNERIVNLSLSPTDDSYFIIQSCGVPDQSIPVSDPTEMLLREIKKLYPYLNKPGKEILNQVVEESQKKLSEIAENARIKCFTDKIVLHFPLLTPTEQYLCALILMGFSVKEISCFNGFSGNSIRVNLHRICQKYDIESRYELFNILNSKLNQNLLIEELAYN